MVNSQKSNAKKPVELIQHVRFLQYLKSHFVRTKPNACSERLADFSFQGARTGAQILSSSRALNISHYSVLMMILNNRATIHQPIDDLWSVAGIPRTCSTRREIICFSVDSQFTLLIHVDCWEIFCSRTKSRETSYKQSA